MSDKNLLDILLDEDNEDETITMYDGDGNELEFEQVAVIPLDDELYCILKPISEIEGVADDEAIVFHVIVNKDNPKDALLSAEADEEIAMKVFEEYYKLLDEQEID